MKYDANQEAKRRIRQEDIKRMARMAEIKNLKLPKEQALKVVEKKLVYKRQLLKLNEQTLPNQEKREHREKMKDNYYSKVKTLIGDVKYAQWIAFQNTSHERFYKKKFGFTQAQYEKYENKKERHSSS